MLLPHSNQHKIAQNNKEKIMKHVGKMKNNGTRVVIIYRTLPGDPHYGLVCASGGLRDIYHDNLMSVLEHDSGQQAEELADVLAVRKFPDGNNMLEYLHVNGHLKRVPTNLVLVTPDNKTSIQLDELNKLIADQRGITLEELAIKDGSNSTVATMPNKKPEAAKEYLPETNEIIIDDNTVTEEAVPETVKPKGTKEEQAKFYRSQADKLAKEAAKMRQLAEDLVPTKKKAPAKTKAEA
jgi:hypothetical protein